MHTHLPCSGEFMWKLKLFTFELCRTYSPKNLETKQNSHFKGHSNWQTVLSFSTKHAYCCTLTKSLTSNSSLDKSIHES